MKKQILLLVTWTITTLIVSILLSTFITVAVYLCIAIFVQVISNSLRSKRVWSYGLLYHLSLAVVFAIASLLTAHVFSIPKLNSLESYLILANAAVLSYCIGLYLYTYPGKPKRKRKRHLEDMLPPSNLN